MKPLPRWIASPGRPNTEERKSVDRRLRGVDYSVSVKRICPVEQSVIFLILILLLACKPAIARQLSNEPGFFLPKNPRAAAYMLGRLSNQALIDAPRGEFVYTALLQREGLDRKYLFEALDGLAAIRRTDRLTELLRALTELDQKGATRTGPLRALADILLSTDRAQLSGKLTNICSMSLQGELPLTRQIGWAARAVVAPSISAVWQEAQGDPLRLRDLASAIPLIPDSGVRAQFYSEVKALLKPEAAPVIMDAAAPALVSIPGHDIESFRILAGLVQAGVQDPALLDSLERIAPANWPGDDLNNLAQAILKYLEQVPNERRTEASFATALRFETELANRLPTQGGQALSKILRGLGPTVITLRTVYEQMRFDKDLIVVEAGKPVAITLQNDDAMPHNLAILAPGALQEIGMAAEKMPPQPDSEGRLYVPDSPKVLHASRLAAAGQKLELAFEAPKDDGDYPYVCTFPGHWLRMSGTMKVVTNLEAYLASHPVSQQAKLTEWKVADFSADIPRAEQGRNLAAGKELFTKLACVQCHKLGSQGYAYGPDLTDVFKRYKDDGADVLQQILEPSRKIDERYRNYTFDLKTGDPVLGIILKEDDQTVTIQSGPAESLIQALKKSEIQGRRAQASSPMPVGLLNSLSKVEIFDLLAYLQSGGNVPAHEHAHNAEEATSHH